MNQNKYDEIGFFEKYSQMGRSTEGLKGAGEWHELQKMIPQLKGRQVLDLGCGFGWHCQYAVEQGANKVVGVDISQKMLDRARATTDSSISYHRMSLEEMDFQGQSFDVIISSLAIHYLADFEAFARQVYALLQKDGRFVFSVEHPIFTAEGSEQWAMDSKGEIDHWPVDRYFEEGVRSSVFLGESVEKYHRTVTTYLNTLLQVGFSITGIIEPMPSKEHLEMIPEMAEELRRPMMLLVSAKK